jgi:hypothetical protein
MCEEQECHWNEAGEAKREASYQFQLLSALKSRDSKYPSGEDQGLGREGPIHRAPTMRP